MPSEETENITAEDVGQVEEIQETQEVQNTEDNLETNGEPQDAKEESGGSFVKRVKEAAKARLFGTPKEEEGDDIPDEFVQAARRMNWSDEETIAYADQYTDAELLEKIPSILGEAAVKSDDTSDKVDIAPETVNEKVEDSQEGDALKAALDRIAALEEKQGISEAQAREKESADFNRAADELFDKASEEFEVFGKTENLPRFPDGRIDPTSPQMKARLEVFGNAQALKEAGMPGKQALEFSFNAYKGANLKVETQRSVIKDLKKREQKLSGRRTSHKATEAAELTGPETIAEVKRRYGK